MVDADHDSQRFALANMVLQLGPTEAFKSDRHFVSMLRKVAANQTSHQLAAEFKAAATERFQKEQDELKAKGVDVDANRNLVNGIQDMTDKPGLKVAPSK